MNNKKLLIVNWGTTGTEYAFRVASNKNIEIHLASGVGYPKWVHKYVNRKNIYVTDTFSSESLICDTIKYIKGKKITFDGITTFFEMNIIPTADLCETLGFKYFLPSRVARRTSANKAVMRHLCAKHGVLSPKFEIFTTTEDGYKKLKRVGAPAIIKPIMAGHSIGVTYVSNFSKSNFRSRHSESIQTTKRLLKDIINLNNPQTNVLLLEEYLNGDVFSVDGIVQNTKVIFWGIAKFEMSPLPDFIQESVTVPADIPKKTSLSLKTQTIKALHAMDMKTGAFHAEYRLEKKGPVLLEIAGRPAGGYMPLAYKNSFGIDMISMYIDLCLGIKLKPVKTPIQKVVCHKSYFEKRNGQILNISGIDKLIKKGFFKPFWHRKNREMLFYNGKEPNSMLFFQVIADSHQKLKKNIAVIDKTFKYKVVKTPLWHLQKVKRTIYAK